jgi:Holliday junction resolvasome RuvABC endonuclease subunit
MRAPSAGPPTAVRSAAMRVTGLDLSFTKAGLATPEGTTARLAAPTAAGGRDTYERLYRHATAVTRAVARTRPDLVVIEDYAPNSRGILATIRGAEAGGMVRAALWRLGLTVELVKPNVLKAWATGKGNADKAAMVDAARQLGATDLGLDDDDQADAYLLRAYALDTLTRHQSRGA